MIVKTDLPGKRLDRISDQIASMLGGLLYGRSPQPYSVGLCESFEMWTLNLTNLTESAPKYANFPDIQTGYWHHQIFLDGEPKAHARSKVLPKKPARVVEVAISPLAEKIDDAIEWVESPERDWATSELVHLHLLALPSLLIYTFRLVEPKKLYVIDAFPGFVSLKQGQLLDQGDFLTALYGELQSQEERFGERNHSR